MFVVLRIDEVNANERKQSKTTPRNHAPNRRESNRKDSLETQPSTHEFPLLFAISENGACLLGWKLSGPDHAAEVGNVCGVLLIALNVFVSSNDHPVWASCLTGFVHVLFVCLLSQESMNHSLGSLREDGRLVVRV